MTPLDRCLVGYWEDVTDITAEDFEKMVRSYIMAAAGAALQDFKVEHKAQLTASDGTYEIDVTATFRALGADFLVLIECKHHRHPIKREVVQVLHSRLQSLGAHKGMLFATSDFQQGAIEYATLHGIALIRVASGTTCYLTRSTSEPSILPDWLPKYVGWMIKQNARSLVSEEKSKGLREYLLGEEEGAQFDIVQQRFPLG
jgi:restriction system protein